MKWNRRHVVAGLGASIGYPAALTALGQETVARAPERPQRAFRPGAVWLDTSGKPIQAHGGSIIQIGNLFYWYGENKEKTKPGSGIWHWGVRAYSSSDLYNWQDLGVIIPPVTDDKTSPLYPASKLDRPHILFHQRLKKFVCWLKIMEKDGAQTRTVLVADQFAGPYKIVRQGLRPLGMNAGDFDLAFSPADGKAYMYFERVHSEMICADLTDDYTDFNGYYSTHFPRPNPPLVREGPAHFFRQGKHYLATSGTTGYFPNPSEIAVADTFHGPWTVLGDLHPDDQSRTSYNSQICSVFRHPKKEDLYIALADRWIGPQTSPDFVSGQLSTTLRNGITKALGPDHVPLDANEMAAMKWVVNDSAVNTSEARYVWLPIIFDGDRPIIKWRDEWSIDEFG